MTPQSGTSYGAGFAYGLPWSDPAGQIDLVLYWYQSTASVTGITGTSRSPSAASSCLTIECCFAESRRRRVRPRSACRPSGS